MSEGITLGMKLFLELIGIKTTRVKLGHGSFITIDWGKNSDASHLYHLKGGNNAVGYY